MSGLGVVGRDRYGVFPLRGKMLNVREASLKQVRPNSILLNVISWQLHGSVDAYLHLWWVPEGGHIDLFVLFYLTCVDTYA